MYEYVIIRLNVPDCWPELQRRHLKWSNFQRWLTKNKNRRVERTAHKRLTEGEMCVMARNSSQKSMKKRERKTDNSGERRKDEKSVYKDDGGGY
jgi:hypothetical protein